MLGEGDEYKYSYEREKMRNTISLQKRTMEREIGWEWVAL